MVAASGIGFVRHEGGIRSTETDWLPYGIPPFPATRWYAGDKLKRGELGSKARLPSRSRRLQIQFNTPHFCMLSEMRA
jgi:hypothetical protein